MRAKPSTSLPKGCHETPRVSLSAANQRVGGSVRAGCSKPAAPARRVRRDEGNTSHSDLSMNWSRLSSCLPGVAHSSPVGSGWAQSAALLSIVTKLSQINIAGISELTVFGACTLQRSCPRHGFATGIKRTLRANKDLSHARSSVTVIGRDNRVMDIHNTIARSSAFVAFGCRCNQSGPA
jgi:hypothetical protein